MSPRRIGAAVALGLLLLAALCGGGDAVDVGCGAGLHPCAADAQRGH